ncbi:MFS transporter [Salinigranum halophilum]|jgi:MFS family permease|uniref:MFS transporter n=1 Tax=Salinigranum halophilum TaxID=2565931 RepID=UPI0010A8648D|nr:MFS transporter [Salinigranum halophilum]
MGTERRDRVVLALVVWSVLVSQVLLYPGLADLVRALGGRGLDAATAFLVAEVAAFVTFASVWGALSDATGRRLRWVVVGALGGALSYLLLAALPTLGVGFGVALVIRVVGGAFTIGAFSLAVTTLADLGGGNGRNMGVAGLAIGLGAALGAVVGGRLSTLDPLAPLVAAAGLLFVVATLSLSVTDRAPSGRNLGVGAIVRGLRSRPALSVPYAFGFVDRLTAGFFALVGVFYFRTQFGLDAAGAGVVLALFFLPFALLQYPLGVVSDRVGRFYPVVAGSAAYGVAIIGVGLAPSLVSAASMMVVVGVFGALVAPATMALATDLVPEDERGVALGGFNVAGSLGFLTGFLVGGLSADSLGFLPAFLIVGGLEVAIAVVALRAVRELKPFERAVGTADD